MPAGFSALGVFAGLWRREEAIRFDFGQVFL
jgi:hypothetical protein